MKCFLWKRSQISSQLSVWWYYFWYCFVHYASDAYFTEASYHNLGIADMQDVQIARRGASLDLLTRMFCLLVKMFSHLLDKFSHLQQCGKCMSGQLAVCCLSCVWPSFGDDISLVLCFSLSYLVIFELSIKHTSNSLQSLNTAVVIIFICLKSVCVWVVMDNYTHVIGFVCETFTVNSVVYLDIFKNCFVCRTVWELESVSRVSDQNGVSLQYITLEIHHSGREPSICVMKAICLMCEL